LLVWMLPLNFGWAYLSSCNAREAALILISTLLCHVPPLVVSILSLKLFFRYNNYPLSFSYIIFSKQQSLQIGMPWTSFFFQVRLVFCAPLSYLCLSFSYFMCFVFIFVARYLQIFCQLPCCRCKLKETCCPVHPF
jgi:hypothetical protein